MCLMRDLLNKRHKPNAIGQMHTSRTMTILRYLDNVGHLLHSCLAQLRNHYSQFWLFFFVVVVIVYILLICSTTCIHYSPRWQIIQMCMLMLWTFPVFISIVTRIKLCMSMSTNINIGNRYGMASSQARHISNMVLNNSTPHTIQFISFKFWW